MPSVLAGDELGEVVVKGNCAGWLQVISGYKAQCRSSQTIGSILDAGCYPFSSIHLTTCAFV